MAESTSIEIPSLPIGEAAKGIIDGAPVLGGIVVLQFAVIVFIVVWATRALKDKDGKLETANEKLVEAYKTIIPVIADLKDMTVDLAVNLRSRNGARTRP